MRKYQVFLIALFIGFYLPINAQDPFHSFNEKWDVFVQNHVEEGLVDYDKMSLKDLEWYQENMKQWKVDWTQPNIDKATWINAYNFAVISEIIKTNVRSSVQDIPGFFTRQKIIVGDRNFSLNDFEKLLFDTYPDPRMHFALICGAKGCPKMFPRAFNTKEIDQDLDKQSKLALSDASFIYAKGENLFVSKILDWYKDDFGKNTKERIELINSLSGLNFSSESKIKYLPYDWSLNTTSSKQNTLNSTNQYRYIVSSTIPKGTYEFKAFNNLYSQTINDVRSTYFTTIYSALYGLNHRLNVGLQSRFRMTTQHFGDSTPFSIFNSTPNKRQRFTGIGPMIRYAPVPKWENFSIQSTFLFPLGADLEGNAQLLFLEWQGPIWNTQFFNDFSIKDKFSLFTEIDLLVEDIGNSNEGYSNRFSTPIMLILSYVPTQKISTYFLSGYSPFWGSAFDYFVQIGAGFKYQFTPQLELELLTTWFDNQFLEQNDGNAQTINIGVRYNH